MKIQPSETSISVVIPSKNKPLVDLARMVNHTLKNAKDLEIIIIDQTVGRIEKLPSVIHILTTEPKSAISARHIGGEMATGSIIVFLDDDIFVSDTFFSFLKQFPLSDDAISFYAPVVIDSFHSKTFIYIRALIELICMRGQDIRILNRARLLLGLDRKPSNYFWGGAIVTNRLGVRFYRNQLPCPGQPIQLGDMEFGRICQTHNIRLAVPNELYCIHDDPHSYLKPQNSSLRRAAIEFERYNKFQGILFKFLLQLKNRLNWNRPSRLVYKNVLAKRVLGRAKY